MKQVASLQYGVIFKKAFSQPDIFTAFVRAVLGIDFSCDVVETEKSFSSPIGNVDSRFDLFAQDEKNRIIVDIQHVRSHDHYDRFLHYHCVALLEQVANAKNYRHTLKIFTIVVLTSGDRHQKDVLTVDFDPKDLNGKGVNEIPHKIIYLCPKYASENTPAAYREWMDAIQDTLDEEVDETHYHELMIQKIFDSIEKDDISPTERARMFEEYNNEEHKQTMFAEGELKAKQTIVENMLAKGFDWETITELTGLTIEAVAELRNND
jgi:predicted transposase/invertase (TIGR01784 family)